MKPVKLFFINLGVLIGGILLVRLFLGALFDKIFNAIIGNPYLGDYIGAIFVRIFLFVCNGLVICMPHAKNEKSRKEFLNILGAEKYDRKADFKNLASTKQFRTECIIFAILYIIMAILSRPLWLYVIAILAFPFINLWHQTAVHKKWASERLHLAYKE